MTNVGYKVTTVTSDIESQFDQLVTEFISTHNVLDMNYRSGVTTYNGNVQPFFIVHIKHLSEVDK